MRMRADGFYSLDGQQMIFVEDFVERYPICHAVCGIGNPSRFFQSLNEVGLSITQHVYRDHHDFDGSEVKFEDDMVVVCTEKDAAKLNNLDTGIEHVWFLRVSVELPSEASTKLRELLRTRAISPRRVNQDGELITSGMITRIWGKET